MRASADGDGLDAATLCSLIRAESRFHADAVSPRGAVGLMQIMPDTGAWIAEQVGLRGSIPKPLRSARRTSGLARGTCATFSIGLESSTLALDGVPRRPDARGGVARLRRDPICRRLGRTSSASFARYPSTERLYAGPILLRITPSLLF